MTEEELKKEARKYLVEHSEYSEVFGQTFIKVDTLTAMVDFAEPREKRIAELEVQIEEMKCCGNCAKYNSGYGENPCKLTSSGICGEWETSIGKW